MTQKQQPEETAGAAASQHLDDEAFLAHILAQKPAEELVDIPEWKVTVLCRALNAKARVDIQLKAYDEQTKRVDYRTTVFEVILAGTFNPATGHPVFADRHRGFVMQEQDGRPVERLFMTIMRLSGLFASEQEKARKN